MLASTGGWLPTCKSDVKDKVVFFECEESGRPPAQNQVIINLMVEAIYKLNIHVGPESIDLLEHVNNREYLRWMEEGAVAHAAHNGWPFEALKSINAAWVARQHWIEYLRPALLDDDLVLYTWVQSLKRFSSLRRYALKRGDEVLMVGATEWVFVDFTLRKPVPIHPGVVDSFELVGADSPRLTELGIQRLVRFMPSPGL